MCFDLQFILIYKEIETKIAPNTLLNKINDNNNTVLSCYKIHTWDYYLRMKTEVSARKRRGIGKNAVLSLKPKLVNRFVVIAHDFSILELALKQS